MSGSEVAIEWQGRPARAWLPDPVTGRDLELPVNIARATERVAAAVRAVGARLPGAWEPLARLLLRAEGVASSNIEGLRAPVAQIAAAELDETAVPRDAAWVADNLAVVTQALEHARSRRRLTLPELYAWHRRLMRHSDLAPNLIGRFRDAQGWLGGRSPQDAAYVPPPAAHVPSLMNDLIAFANARAPDGITQAAVAHAQFETVHPYGDGNGRIGRMLVLWILARRLDVAVPPPISVRIARDPGGYLAGLHWFRAGELTRWVGWFADIVETSAVSATEWGAELESLMHRWRGTLADLRADSAAHAILEILPAHPVLTAETTAQFASVSPTAARTALEALHDRGILEPYDVPAMSTGRPRKWWLARALADLVRA